LRARKTESPGSLKRRLATAEEEMEAAGGFDHRVVNDVLEDAVAAIERILGSFPNPTRWTT